MVGNKYGRWEVLNRAEPPNKKSHDHYWICQCDCEDRTIKKVAGSSLLSGSSKSCGCLNKELIIKRFKKYNEYNLLNEYGIGYDSNGLEFYFDLDDYNKIKNYCWIVEKNGYVATLDKGKRVRQHSLIMGRKKSKEIDHINQIPQDNRKNNLRFVTSQQNVMNRSATSNKSGVMGVSETKSGKWHAYIMKDRVNYNLGVYDCVDRAIYARLKKEKELFGKYAGQKHLFEQYGVYLGGDLYE